MTPLQNAIEFITAKRDRLQPFIDEHGVFVAWRSAAKRDGYQNVLDVLGNMELSEAEQYCLTCYERSRKLDAFSIGDEPRWEIGQRIAEQRQEAQS